MRKARGGGGGGGARGRARARVYILYYDKLSMSPPRMRREERYALCEVRPARPFVVSWSIKLISTRFLLLRGVSRHGLSHVVPALARFLHLFRRAHRGRPEQRVADEGDALEHVKEPERTDDVERDPSVLRAVPSRRRRGGVERRQKRMMRSLKGVEARASGKKPWCGRIVTHAGTTESP